MLLTHILFLAFALLAGAARWSGHHYWHYHERSTEVASSSPVTLANSPAEAAVFVQERSPPVRMKTNRMSVVTKTKKMTLPTDNKLVAKSPVVLLYKSHPRLHHPQLPSISRTRPIQRARRQKRILCATWQRTWQWNIPKTLFQCHFFAGRRPITTFHY